MLEWQGQVSMLLKKLTTSVSPKLYLVILNVTVKPLHQVTLPPEVTTKLALPMKPKCPSQMEKLVALISPDPEYMKPWAGDSATLYLTVTLYYVVRKAVGAPVNMKQPATLFCVKMTGLHHCINGRKYEGGSKKAAQH